MGADAGRLEKAMIVRRKSPVTGEENEMDLPITIVQYTDWRGGMLIQKAMPHLTVEQREFLISGCFGTDWKTLWGKEDGEETE